jgi:metal-sulfur cluster biosynthetic enzyme
MSTTIPRKKEDRTEGFWQQLNTVLDPEIGYGIVDLGLIYDVHMEKGVATVVMTLTSPMCPAGPEIMEGVQTALRGFEGISDVIVELVWEPSWTDEMVDSDIRGMLFGTD